ncbi:origin recognition complex subunit 3-like isoform X2 [Ornithodoros turicata]|uniref:origin recognition complex subunit 3-like isoform X2 n=1 Tax=Ornithodoros turicata TaxID=34597 RepID=UPI00313879DC
MDSLKSISQACFVSLPQKRNSSETSKVLDVGIRDTLYRETWTRLENEILQCQKDAQADALNAMVDFIRRSNPGLRDRNQVPCGALVMGVNMSDHTAVFGHLTSRLKGSVTRMVSSLQARDCNSISSMMQKVISDILEAVVSDVEMKKSICTMATLSAWHKSITEKMERSPRKKAKRSCTLNDPMVIIIEEVEGFKPSVLQDFILICSNYINQLPLVLVFGISTMVSTIHGMIPERASSCLSIETFSSMPVTEYLNRVFQEVLLNPSVPFKFGHHVFQLVQDIVLFHDFSLMNLLQILKMCLFEHYYSGPASVLCCPEDQLEGVVQTLTRQQISLIMNLPSVERCMEDNKLSTSKQANQRILIDLVKMLHSHHRSSVTMLKALHEFSKDLPNWPLGHQLRDTYLLFLQTPAAEMEGFKSLIKLTRLMSRDEIETRLCSAMKVINREESVVDPNIEDLASGIGSILDKLREITKEETESKHEQDGLESVPIDWGNVRSRSQFKEKLKSLTKAKKQSPFEAVREELAQFIDKTFSIISPPTNLALHEALYFDDALVLKHYFLPSPRSVLHGALVNPQAYLKSMDVLPDLSLAYKLHLEGGKLINLYDWMEIIPAPAAHHSTYWLMRLTRLLLL